MAWQLGRTLAWLWMKKGGRIPKEFENLTQIESFTLIQVIDGNEWESDSGPRGRVVRILLKLYGVSDDGQWNDTLKSHIYMISTLKRIQVFIIVKGTGVARGKRISHRVAYDAIPNSPSQNQVQ